VVFQYLPAECCYRCFCTLAAAGRSIRQQIREASELAVTSGGTAAQAAEQWRREQTIWRASTKETRWRTCAHTMAMASPERTRTTLQAYPWKGSFKHAARILRSQTANVAENSPAVCIRLAFFWISATSHLGRTVEYQRLYRPHDSCL